MIKELTAVAIIAIILTGGEFYHPFNSANQRTIILRPPYKIDINSTFQEWENIEPTVEEPEEEEVEYAIGNIFDEEISKVPYEQLQFIYDNGWEFDITGEDFGGYYGYTVSICGLTVYDEKTIYIRDNEWSIHRSAIHELGHALDYEFDWASETDEFKEIFEKEKYNFNDCVSIGDGHEISDVNEYWASVYQNMVLNYDNTYEDIPETVEYIESYLNTI